MSIERFFIPHLMKTGGTTLTWHARATYGLSAVYPHEPSGDGPYLEAYISVPHLVERVSARADDIRVVLGHVPFAVLGMLPGRWRTVVVLRHPLDRIRSLLADQMRRPGPGQGLAPEAVYDMDDFHNLTDDHQTRMLGALPPFPERPLPEGLPCDEATAVRAHKALETIDFLGTQEHYGELLQRLATECGWNVSAADDQNVGDQIDIPPALIDRIMEDNQRDLALYEHACKLLDPARAEV